MATEQELNCSLAKNRWDKSLEEFNGYASTATRLKQDIDGDATYLARQKQFLDEEDVKLTYLNEKVDAHKYAIGNSSDSAEISRLENEMGELDSERERHRGRRAELEAEIASIEARDYENRRGLADAKDGLAKSHAELQSAGNDVQTHCGEYKSLPSMPYL